jgi:hypothetical protein
VLQEFGNGLFLADDRQTELHVAQGFRELVPFPSLSLSE